MGGWYDEPAIFYTHLTVYEAERGDIDTGLLDPAGKKIVRRQMPQTIGFDLTPRPGRQPPARRTTRVR